MLTHNSSAYSVKIVSELIGSILYFPLWWYSRGLVKVLKHLKESIINKEKSLSFLIWLKNIFRPMYGQYDWQGRLISFFIRLVQVIARGAVLVVWLIFLFILFLLWIFMPVIIFYELYLQII